MLIVPFDGTYRGGRICASYLRFRPVEENGQEFAHRYCGESYSIVYLLLYQSVQGCAVRAFSAYFTYHYDVFIAFVGGLVGAISLTREDKGNPIPGVAIATALMPPLCTAGFGLATSNFSYFLGAFYLYSINCFFIGIATFLIIKYLKYTPKNTGNEALNKRLRVVITTLVILIVTPSLYLAYSLLKEKEFHENVAHYITAEFENSGYTIIYKKNTLQWLA